MPVGTSGPYQRIASGLSDSATGLMRMNHHDESLGQDEAKRQTYTARMAGISPSADGALLLLQRRENKRLLQDGEKRYPSLPSQASMLMSVSLCSHPTHKLEGSHTLLSWQPGRCARI